MEYNIKSLMPTADDYVLLERIRSALDKGDLALIKTNNNKYNEGMTPTLMLAILLNRQVIP